MKKTLQILFLIFSISVFSQFSKTHYIPPLSGSDSVPAEEEFIYISTPSTTPINFTIKELGGMNITGTVSRDVPYVYDANSGSAGQLVVEQAAANTIMDNRGYVVEADDVVYVTIRVIAGGGNQAGALVSKGLAALGTKFRIGAFVNTLTANYTDSKYTFASILATENNTTIHFSDLKTGVSLVNNASVGNTPADIVLNAGQSFVMAVQGGGGVDANRDGLIGSAISSDKPIAVNCGSFGGTNGDNNGNLDLGFDQIVSADRTDKDYIFIKSTGQNYVERVLLVADINNTQIFLNGNVSATPNYTLNAGQYVALIGSDYNTNGNMYVHSTEKVFAYQSIGDNGRTDQANQELFFVPPLSCKTPHNIDNIPFINEIGTRSFTGRVTIVAETGATLSFIINGLTYNLSSLPAGINVVGPTNVVGNTNYETYTVKGFTGNVSVYSSGQLYVAAYGTDNAATFGGFYSGFTFKPEITFDTLSASLSSCIPNVELKVSTLTSFNVFQWYFNGGLIPGATFNNYFPKDVGVPLGLGPGYYYVSAAISVCGTTTLNSDEIPVSDCPINTDNDLVNDNIDLDLDNDGIPNCTESLGDLNIDLSTPIIPTNISLGTYSNTFTGTITTTGPALPIGTFVGNTNGNFVSQVPAGKGSTVTYQMDNFGKPMSVMMEYVTTANASDLINSNANYKVKSPINTTVTVLNPTNQLLIDTNYDGIYESGITEFSSFEIRFRLNSSTPLAAGTGTFSFRSHLTTGFSFTQENQLDTIANNATFRIITTCVPNDTDLDGVPDQLDLDSDNDGILDITEFSSSNFIPSSNTDVNHNGLDDAYETGIMASDIDHDGVPDYLDLDSDNDGIFDLVESGSNATDADNNGIIDGNPITFGSNGLANNIETTAGSGVLNYTILNTDADTLANYVDLDSDGDGCNDVIEAGFLDPDGDGQLGAIIPPSHNANGVVTSGTNGYTIPNTNYILAAPIAITTQPIDQTECELQNANFTVVTTPVDSYQWQISTDGGVTFTNLVNNATYSGCTTISLLITSVSPLWDGYKYRVLLGKIGNSCGLLSAAGTLHTFALPVITSPVTYKQCDDNLDGLSIFNLTLKNSDISTNFANETFTYYLNYTAADTADATYLIANPISFSNTTAFNQTVYGRVVNGNNCYIVAQIDLIVSVTQVNAATFHRDFVVCDDSVLGVSTDIDGTSIFDFSSVTNDIKNQLPPPSSNYSVKYYASYNDAYSEINEITSVSNYRNTTLNLQDIYVRVDSNLLQGCYGLGPLVTLTVEALPVAHPISEYKECDDVSNDGIFSFNTTSLEINLLQGQTNVTVAYFDALGNPLQDSNGVFITSPFPANFLSTSQTINVRVTNNITHTNNNTACYDETTIKFTVDIRPIATAIIIPEQCDDAPNDSDGMFSFNTSTFETTILNGQTGLTVSYQYANGTSSSVLPNPFVTATQDVLVTVTNPLNTTCPATTILHFVVHPLPNISLTYRELVCTNLPTFFVTLTAGIQDGSPESDYTYIWTFNGNVIALATSSTLNVNIGGIYTVQVINTFGCSRTRTITVIASDIAHLGDPTVVDLSDHNTITVNILSGQGLYEYSLDEPLGPFQQSNFFDNVSIGFHDVYVNDINGCGIVQQSIAIVGAPKYFTPNGDGFNDYWNIKGIDKNKNYQSILYIYDRFGRLLKQIGTTSLGWDGTYNGNLLPADDYWFTLQLEDGRSAKGHFALKR